jgi:hypothetical protein
MKTILDYIRIGTFCVSVFNHKHLADWLIWEIIATIVDAEFLRLIYKLQIKIDQSTSPFPVHSSYDSAISKSK